MFSGIEHDTDPQVFVDVCDRLCTALGYLPIRAVELTNYQLTWVAYEWYKSLLRSRPAGHPTLEWPEFYNAIVERLMSESLRDAKVQEFELLKRTKSMSVLEYDTKFNQLVRYTPHMVVIDNIKAQGLLMALRSTCLGRFL